MISWIVGSIWKWGEDSYKLDKREKKLLDVIITYGVLWDVWVFLHLGFGN